MIEFFEDKGTWGGWRVNLQGIFEDGSCIACKVLDSDDKPFSWGLPDAKLQGFTRTIQRLYDEKREGAE